MKPWYGMVLAFAVVAPPGGAQGLSVFAQFRTSCLGGATCGLLGFSVVMHSSSGTGTCTESCVFFSNPNLECGPCPSAGTNGTPGRIPNELSSTPGYDIYLDLVGVPASDTSVFVNARARWQSVVLSDLSDIATGGITTASGCSVPSIIDDLYICAKYVSIDGAGKILGQAGPAYIRTSNSLTITGEMEFDSPDIATLRTRNILNNVILHEMGHILGTLDWCIMKSTGGR
jgi:hypothetical protein